MSEGYEKLINQANIGADFREFVSSNVGAYLVERAEREEIEILRKLADVAPDNTEAIYKLQLQAKVPKKLMQFISEAIRDGNVAKWSLEQSI